MRTARDGAQALHEALRPRAAPRPRCSATPPPPAKGSTAPARRRSRPPGRARADSEREYELLLEMILEGYRLHYDEPLVVRPEDVDLALLLGDQLYALGLSRLAALGDLTPSTSSPT